MLHKFKTRVARTPVKSTGQALGRVNDTLPKACPAISAKIAVMHHINNI